MPNWSDVLQAEKSASTVLVLFVPSVDRFNEPIEQEYWVTETLIRIRPLVRRCYGLPTGAGRLER